MANFHNPGLVRSIIAFASVIMLVFLAITAWNASKAYRVALNNAEKRTATTADLLHQQIQTTIETPTVVFVSIESEYAAYGGLGAVMRLLPNTMASDPDSLPCFVLAPYFKHITDLDALLERGRIERYATRLSFCLIIRGIA